MEKKKKKTCDWDGRQGRKEAAQTTRGIDCPSHFVGNFFFYLSFNEEIGGGRDRKERGGGRLSR